MASKYLSLKFSARMKSLLMRQKWASGFHLLSRRVSSSQESESVPEIAISENMDDDEPDSENLMKEDSKKKLPNQDKLKAQAIEDLKLDEDDWKKAVAQFHSLSTCEERSAYINKVMESPDEKFIIPSLNDRGDLFGIEKMDLLNSSPDEVFSFLEKYDLNNEFLKVVCQTVAKHLSSLNFEETIALVDCASTIGCSDRVMELHLADLAIQNWFHFLHTDPESIIKALELTQSSLKVNQVENILFILCNTKSVFHLKSVANIFVSLASTTLASEVSSCGFYLTDRNGPYKVHKYLIVLSRYLINDLKSEGINQNNYELITAFMSLCGKFLCPDLSLPNFISDVFCGSQNNYIHNLSFLDSFLEMCVGSNYYNTEVFHKALALVQLNLAPENMRLLCRILRWLAFFECHSKELLAEVVELSGSCDFSDSSSLWDIMLYSLCMDYYHPTMLKHFLSDNSVNVDFGKGLFLLKVMVGLTSQRQNIADITEEAFFHPRYKAGMNELLKKAYKTLTFSEEETRDMEFSQIVGSHFGVHGQTNVLTMGGHIIDYELLLGEGNKIIQFPKFLVQRSYIDGLNSIAVLPEVAVDIDPHIFTGRVNFASDWMEYMYPGYENLLTVHKKVAFLWPKQDFWFKITRRQLEAMGWTVLIMDDQFQKMTDTSKTEFIISQINEI